MKEELTQEKLKELLYYDQLTGVFKWKIKPRQSVNIGDIAGTILKKGYISIAINRKRYQAHRLAWLYVYGKWPENQIDHKDTVKHHNWIKNLREATNTQNQQNKIVANRNNKSSGILGVQLDKRSCKYKASIRVDYKPIHLGYFETKEEAHEAYITAKRELHPFNTI